MFGLSLSWILLIGVAIYLVRKLLRRKAGKKPAKVRTEIERWIDDALARELGRKLGIEHDVVRRALEGVPEPDTVGSVEEAVRSMQAKYARTPDGSVDVRLDVAFEDGTATSASRVFTGEHVPSDVKAEFERTGGAFVFRAVYFPWSSPD